MAILYLLGIKIFHLLVIVASIFNSKAKLWLQGRKRIFQKLESEIENKPKIAWFHCASLGEFEQGRPLIESFRESYPEYKIMLTFYSPSGYEIRKNYDKADYIYYLPLDTPKNARKFLDIVNPSIVFFIKYEFWYFFLKEVWERKIPLYLVSGIFRKNQRFFKRFGFMAKRMLGYFNHFFVQNNESLNLLKSINLENVTVTGDTRFDRVYSIAQQSKHLPLVEQFKQNEIVIIAGSSWKPDEEILIKYINETNYKFKVIIAPHEIHKENINRIIKSISEEKKVLKYSEADENNISNTDVLIVDSIGLLSSLYRYGDIAYIGGGFGKGIHNTLEAATFGLPVIFGPNYLKFQEAVELVKLNGAFSITSYNDFNDCLDKLFDNQEDIKQKGAISAGFVESGKGATLKILEKIEIAKK